MSSFQIGPGNEICVDGQPYKADARGIVTVPSEFDEVLTNRHGLTLFIEVEAPATPAEEAPVEVVDPVEVEAPAEAKKAKAK